jgi:hypothetical protein
MLDSLVRVSRRAGSNHFLSIPSVHGQRRTVASGTDSTASSPIRTPHQSATHPAEKAYTVMNSSVLSTTRYAGYNKHDGAVLYLPTYPIPRKQELMLSYARPQRSGKDPKELQRRGVTPHRHAAQEHSPLKDDRASTLV